MKRLSYKVVRMYAAHHLQYQSLLSVAQVGTGNTLLESEVKAVIKDMCEQEPTGPKEGTRMTLAFAGYGKSSHARKRNVRAGRRSGGRIY